MTIMDASSFGPSDEALLTMNSSSRKITGSGRQLRYHCWISNIRSWFLNREEVSSLRGSFLETVADSLVNFSQRILSQVQSIITIDVTELFSANCFLVFKIP